MGPLEGEWITVSRQPINCLAPLSIAALTSCYGNTVCLQPSTHAQQQAVTLTVTGSTEVWLQGPIKVITILAIKKSNSSAAKTEMLQTKQQGFLNFHGKQFVSCLWVVGFHLGGNSRQRLQKSFSLDETKTKMASSIIKNVLSKKMKVEQSNSKTPYLQKTAVLTSLPQPAHQQGVREDEGGKTGGGVLKVPVHAVRDMRSLLKKPHNLSFSTAPTTPESNKLGSIKAIGQEESPPPSYQQAVGVEGHKETKRSFKASVSSSGGNITKVASCFSQSQDRKPSNRFGCPITQQRQDSQEVINRIKVDDVTRPAMLDLPTNSTVSSDLSKLSQSERAGGMGQQARTYLPTPAFIQPPPQAPSISRHPKMTHPQEQSSIPDVSSQFAPTSSQQILHSYFYTPTTLAGPAPTLYPNIGRMSYVHRPLSFIQAQLQPIRPAPTLHLLRRSEETQSGSTRQTSRPLDSFVKTCPPRWTQTAGDQESNGDTVTPATPTQVQPELQKQQLQQQQFLCSVQGFLPAQVGSDILIDVQGSAASSGTLFTGHAPCHIMLKPKSGQCLYVNTPTQPQRKMLLDPETGQYVQVFLPAVSCANNTSVFPVPYGNHTSFVTNHAPSTINSNTSLLSVMHFQPMVPVSSLYTHPCLPSNPPHIIS